MYQFQKKDGSLVNFEDNKILVGIIKAGGSPEEAQTVLKAVNSWLPSVVVNNIVQTADMRDKVLTELKKLNPAVAASFEAYKKG